MNLGVTYILSQIFTIIMYIFTGLTYYAKDRKKILILSFMSLISIAIAYIFLNAWTGLAMDIVAIIRNIIFLIDEKKNGKRDKNTKTDAIILVGLYVISIVAAVFTYNGLLSLASVIATCIYTFSVWQKNVKLYKFLGIFVETLWMIYNIYIMSIFGIILEAVVLICAITGYITETKKNK